MDKISLSGVVGFDITGDSVREQLKKVEGDEVVVYINSPGGYVFDGLEVYNELKNSGKKIITVISGFAASMGSIIFLAGDVRYAPTGSLYMIHPPSGLAMGKADEFRKEADVLDKIEGSLKDIYRERANIENLDELVAQETWFNVEEMKKHGITTGNIEDFLEIATEEKEAKEKTKEEVVDKVTLEEMKAELETQKAELQALKEANEKAELEKQLADIKAQKEALEADPKEDEADEDNQDNEDKAKEANPKEENEDDEKEAEPKAKASTVKIEVKSSIEKKQGEQEVPVFMQKFERAY